MRRGLLSFCINKDLRGIRNSDGFFLRFEVLLFENNIESLKFKS